MSEIDTHQYSKDTDKKQMMRLKVLNSSKYTIFLFSGRGDLEAVREGVNRGMGKSGSRSTTPEPAGGGKGKRKEKARRRG